MIGILRIDPAGNSRMMVPEKRGIEGNFLPENMLAEEFAGLYGGVRFFAPNGGPYLMRLPHRDPAQLVSKVYGVKAFFTTPSGPMYSLPSGQILVG